MSNNIMKIYIRSDLKMRKGKMAAQAAHAAMKLMLETMKKENDDLFIISAENEKKLTDLFSSENPEKQIQIVFVKDENELHDKLSTETVKTVIIDHGRTEFHGVKTITCAASGFFNNSASLEIIPPDNTDDRSIFSKQMIIFDKTNPLSKETACQLSVFNCLRSIFNKVQNRQLIINNDSEFSLWLKGAFAKISLSVKTEAEIENLFNELKAADIKAYCSEIGNNKCLVTEPKFPENIDPFTRLLSLI